MPNPNNPMDAFREACRNPNLSNAQALAFHPDAQRIQNQAQQPKPNYEEIFYDILKEVGWHYNDGTMRFECFDTFFDLRLVWWWKKQGGFNRFVLCLKKVYDDQIKERGYPLDDHQKQAILCFMQRRFVK